MSLAKVFQPTDELRFSLSPPSYIFRRRRDRSQTVLTPHGYPGRATEGSIVSVCFRHLPAEVLCAGV